MKALRRLLDRRLAEEQKEKLERIEELEQFVQELKKENYWIERLAKEQKGQKEKLEKEQKEKLEKEQREVKERV